MPLEGLKLTIFEIDAAAHLHISTGDVTVILGVPKDAPLEKRIDVLEQNLSRLREDTEKKAARLSNQISEVNQTVMAHKAQWDTEQQSTRQQIEQFAVGGLRYEIVGLAWLFFGTLFSNLPEECARIFGPVVGAGFLNK